MTTSNLVSPTGDRPEWHMDGSVEEGGKGGPSGTVTEDSRRGGDRTDGRTPS